MVLHLKKIDGHWLVDEKKEDSMLKNNSSTTENNPKDTSVTRTNPDLPPSDTMYDDRENAPGIK